MSNSVTIWRNVYIASFFAPDNVTNLWSQILIYVLFCVTLGVNGILKMFTNIVNFTVYTLQCTVYCDSVHVSHCDIVSRNVSVIGKATPALYTLLQYSVDRSFVSWLSEPCGEFKSAQLCFIIPFLYD